MYVILCFSYFHADAIGITFRGIIFDFFFFNFMTSCLFHFLFFMFWLYDSASEVVSSQEFHRGLFLLSVYLFTMLT